MIQPESGPATIRDLEKSSDPGVFTIGRFSSCITTQGCNPWTILRIAYDYYREMHRRYPQSDLWVQRMNELLETEERWAGERR